MSLCRERVGIAQNMQQQQQGGNRHNNLQLVGALEYVRQGIVDLALDFLP